MSCVVGEVKTAFQCKRGVGGVPKTRQTGSFEACEFPLICGAGAIGAGPKGMAIAAGAVPVGSWILDRIGNVVELSHGATRMLDWVRAANALTSTDVVLVSRLRQRVSK